jgi:hypothetical protein
MFENYLEGNQTKLCREDETCRLKFCLMVVNQAGPISRPSVRLRSHLHNAAQHNTITPTSYPSSYPGSPFIDLFTHLVEKTIATNQLA